MIKKNRKSFVSKKKDVVLLAIKKSYKIPYLIQEARKREWRFFEIPETSRYIPESFNIIGAITDAIPDKPFCKKLRKMNCPVVRIGELPHPQDHLQQVVLPDKFQAGVMAADHYASRGFKNIGFLGHTPWGDGEALFGGFLKQGEQLGLKMTLGRKVPITVPPEFKKSKQERSNYVRNFRNNELKKWLKTLPRPIGILGYNHIICSDIDLLCDSLSISVPGEISILCYTDVPQCITSYTQLSAIDIGMKNISRQVIKLLSDMIDGNPPSESRIFVPPSRIILRQSTDILAVPDPAVARALSFIWENISEPISVENVAEASGIHIRTLNRSFKKCLKRTITEEMLRKRLERASELLRNSTLAVSDIIKSVGFSSTSYFHKRFRDAYGMTPNSFRSKRTLDS